MSILSGREGSVARLGLRGVEATSQSSRVNLDSYAQACRSMITFNFEQNRSKRSMDVGLVLQ
jgi:hypothetical protein